MSIFSNEGQALQDLDAAFDIPTGDGAEADAEGDNTPADLPNEAENADSSNDTNDEQAEPAAAEAEGSEPDATETEEEPQQENEPAPEPASTVDKSRYDAAVREMQEKQREAAESRKQVAALQARVQELEDSAVQMSFAKPQTEEEKAEFLRGLRNNPQRTVVEAAMPVIKSMMDARQKEERARFDAMQRKQESDAAFRTAYEGMTGQWSQLKDPNNAEEVVRKMFELSEKATQYAPGGADPEFWRSAPEIFLNAAATALYGAPVRIDQKAIDEARKRGYEEGLAQRQQREAEKAKAAPAAVKAPAEQAPPSEEDEIVQGILSARSGRVF